MKTLRHLMLFVFAFSIFTSSMAQVAMTETNIKPMNKEATTAKTIAPPKIEKQNETVYVDDENRIYVNKNLPIYLKFSTTPDGETYDLKSLKHPEDAEPLFLDTEGANYIRSKWAVDPETKEYAYPLREVQMELFADSKPPVVKPVMTSTSTYSKAGVVYYGADLSIDMKEWDEQSGVKNSYWSLNNSNWETGKALFEDRSSGDYSFTYYAVDNVNNYTESQSVEFVYDNTAPKTDLLKTKEGTFVFGPKTAVQFNVIEEHSGVMATYFKVSDLNWIKASEGLVLPENLKDGEYEIEYYSVDNVKNGEESQQLKIYLDKVAPVSSLDATFSFQDDNRLYVSGSSKVFLSAEDNKAGVKDIVFSTRGYSNEVYKNEFSFVDFHGLTSVSYWAKDKVDNVEAKNTVEVFVDTLKPTTKIEFLGDYFEVASRYYVNEATQLKLVSSDLNSGVAYAEYAGIGSEFKKYEGPFSLTQEGHYGMMYRTVDNVENAEYSQSIDLYLDKNGPEIIYNFSNRPIAQEGEINVFPDGTRLFLGATDDQSGTKTISYQINNQSAVHYSSPKTIDISEKKAFKKGKVYTVQITTTDLVNNETTETIQFKIED